MISAIKKYRHPGFISPTTHRHLINPEEVVPGIPRDEFIRRRKMLFGESFISDENCIGVLLGSRTRYSSGNIFYPFRQNSNYFYLTGISEPDSCTLFVKKKSILKFITFSNTNNDPMWEVGGSGLENTCSHFNANESYPSHLFYEILRKELKSLSDDFRVYYDPRNLLTCFSSDKQSLYYPISSNKQFKMDDPILSFLQDNNVSIFPFEPLIHRMRLVKSANEVNLIRKACKIAAEGFEHVIKNISKLQTEKEIVSEFRYCTEKLGADDLSFVPVVAGNPHNSCIIHYTRNDMQLERDCLVLMDAGVNYRGYCSDISRTFTASGNCMNKEQKALYDRMLEIQNVVISHCKPGATLAQLHILSFDMIQEIICQNLFCLSRPDAVSLAEELYPHHVSHWLGLDVHDCSNAAPGVLSSGLDWRFDQMQENMILTVEPGIYIPPLNERNGSILQLVPREYRGISIRLEDDILVSSSNPEVLSRL